MPEENTAGTMGTGICLGREGTNMLGLGNAKRTRRLAGLGVSILALVGFAISAAPASAEKTIAKATPKVRKWQSPKAYNAPYALVKVIQNGKPLSKAPVSRCKGTYVSEDIAVMISTCGHHWRVKASYVSMSGHKERFKIVYEPRKGV